MSDDSEFLLQHLQDEGFQARFDDDGDIVFKYEGLTYLLCFDGDDAEFGKLLLPQVWQVATPDEVVLAQATLDDVARRVKVVKGYTVNGQVWFTVEMWLTGQRQWTRHLQRALRALSHAGAMFSQQMRAKAEAAVAIEKAGAAG